MGEIFRNAARVYSWLGEGTPSTDIAMDFCSRIGSQVIMVGIDQGNGINLGIFLQELFSSRKSPSGLTSGAQDLAAFFLGLLRGPRLKAQETGANQLFQGLHDMMNREYWKRIWINQEVSLAKEGVVLSTDPRDIIFALLGVITDNAKLGIQADYHLSMKEVFTVATRAMHECDANGLEIHLCTPDDRNQGILPSWVIDWRRFGLETRQTWPINRSRRWPHYYATGEIDLPTAAFLEVDNQHGILRRNAAEDAHDEITSFIRAIMRQQILTVDSLTMLQKLHLNSVPAPKPQSMSWTVAEKLSNAIGHVQDCVSVSEEGRTLFKTQKGMLGLGHEFIQPGDVVTLLLSCHSPIVLRPRHEGGFAFVGDAYVDGIMQGEFFQTIPTEKEFVIY
ncbi:heterokaryon incompatibility [Fusarium agapanthi]|uniref:Heterokaryon incompatibility n=1 Tax=Fusarium agapanthi TaxID=1803897 RepID=A0A9P5BFG1_9HYPO|nr:heterokaryon incompatibility [Fusarium agapanthi]